MSVSETASYLAEQAMAASLNQTLEHEFDRCAPALYRFIHVRIGGDAHLADDLMQQLWLQARPRAADLPPAEIEPYLRGIAHNLVRLHWRRFGNRPAHVPMADPVRAAELAQRMSHERMPVEELVQREVQGQLLLAITQLSASDQDMIIDHYFRGLSHADLASTRGLTQRAIEGRLYRARQALKSALEHLEF